MEHWQLINSNRNVRSTTPMELWNNAIDYFKYCDDNPIITKRTITQGKETGKLANIEQVRPYTIKALCLHCNILEEYLRDIRDSRDRNNEYYFVVSKILYIIYTQVAEQAITGNFNPIFSAKILNMEREEIPTGGITVNVVSHGIPHLSNSENEILEKLELENRDLEIFKGKNDQRENELYVEE